MSVVKSGDHLEWLNASDDVLTTKDGLPITVWTLVSVPDDEETWSNWARHFRAHYCTDEMIDALKEGTPYEASRKDYLNALVFPDSTSSLGPAIRAGDFAEILVADLIEQKLAYWVPRTRYAAKDIRDESTKGVDVIGIRLAVGEHFASPHDELLTVETKAQLTGNSPKPQLQAAVVDSAKDELRKAETLKQGNFK